MLFSFLFYNFFFLSFFFLPEVDVDGLDLQLHSLPWAQKNVGKKFSGTGAHGVIDLGIILAEFFTQHALVLELEKIVQTKLTKALEGVTDQGRGPATHETSWPLVAGKDPHVTKHTLVKLGGIVLLITFHHINGSNGSVGEAA